MVEKGWASSRNGRQSCMLTEREDQVLRRREEGMMVGEQGLCRLESQGGFCH